MNCTCSLLFIFGISAYFVVGTVARKAIINGLEATDRQFPYQVSLQIQGQLNLCGGGIIGYRFILTTAHCVVSNNGDFYGWDMTVLAGTHNLLKTTRSVMSVRVKKIYVPTEYQPPSKYTPGDIAVLKLNSSLPLDNNNMMHLNLPINQHDTYAGKTAKLAGFGWDWIIVRDNIEQGARSDGRLRFGEVYVFDNTECQYAFPLYNLTHKEICARIHPTHISPATGACNGDSGGPLVYDDTVIGVLSVSPAGCNEHGRFGIYTRVSHYLDFIHNAVTNKINHHHIRAHELIP